MNSLFYCGVERKEIINNFIEKFKMLKESITLMVAIDRIKKTDKIE